MTPVPLVHIITKLEFGGAQQVALDILAHVDRARFTPHLITGQEGYLMEAARGLGFPVHIARNMEREIRPVKDLAAYREIRSILREISRVAVVHTHSSKAGILGRWAAHREGVPVIVHTIHGYGITPLQPGMVRGFLKTAERMTSRVTTHLIAVSQRTREDGIQWGLFGPDKSSVILCGFDLEPVHAAVPMRHQLESEHGIPADAPLALMVACLKHQKAPLDFARAAERVRLSHPEAHFMVAGDGELRSVLETEIRRLGLSDVFHLLGWREDVFGLMKSADVIVLTSLWEGLPLVIPQAHASGRPMVATAVDGSVEAVTEGVDGYLCDPGDLGCFADRIIRLFEDPDLARRMGEAGLQSARRFDRDIMVRKQEELYSELLQNRGADLAGEGSL